MASHSSLTVYMGSGGGAQLSGFHSMRFCLLSHLAGPWGTVFKGDDSEGRMTQHM